MMVAILLRPLVLLLPALGGLTLNPDPKVDNTAAVQNALDAVPDNQSLVLPVGRFRVDGPVFLNRRGVGIIGADGGTTLWGRACRPILTVGFDPKLGLDAWRSLAGIKLDPSLVPARSPRFGYDLGKAACLLPATAAEFGPPADVRPSPTFWRGVRQVSLAAIIVPTAAIDPASPVLTIYTSGQINLGINGKAVVVTIHTTDGDVAWHIRSAIRPGRPIRVAFHVDLEAGVVQGFLDGGAVKLIPGRAPETWRPGLVFVEEVPAEPYFGDPGRGDLSPPVVLAAMRLSSALASPPPKAPDSWYCGRPTNHDFLRVEPQAAPSPFLPIRCNDKQANHEEAGMFVPVAYHLNTGETVWNNTIERLRIESQRGYGVGLLLGSVINFRADRLVFVAGGNGLGQVTSPSSYPMVIERCRAEWASHAAFRVGYAVATLRDIRIEAVGRHAIVLLSAGVVEGLFCGEGGDTSSVFRVWGQADGCQLIVRDSAINYEAFQADRLAHVTQGYTWGTSSPYVELTNVTFNTTRLVPILLDGHASRSPKWKHGIVMLNHAGAGVEGHPCLIEMPDDPWHVETVGLPVPGVPAAVVPSETSPPRP